MLTQVNAIITVCARGWDIPNKQKFLLLSQTRKSDFNGKGISFLCIIGSINITNNGFVDTKTDRAKCFYTFSLEKAL